MAEKKTKQSLLDQIAALQEEADGMEEEEDYEIEIWNKEGDGARVRHSQGRPWLSAKFPELFPAPDESGDGDGDDEDKSKSKPKSGGRTTRTTSQRGNQGTVAGKYFGARTTKK